MAIPIDGDGSGGTPIVDNVTDTNIPVKLAGAYENSPLSWSGVPGENVISSETIEVPPGTIQVGEGLKMSAAGVIPLFNSLLTGKTYIPTLFEYDIATGYNKPFTLVFNTPDTVVVQPDFSTSTPLTGTFQNVVSESEFLLSLGIKTNASATLANVRLQFIAQTTGEPIYFFPSKAGWESDTGEDLIADGAGDATIDFGDAPIGLLVGETVTINYKIDSGVLLGDGAIPYQEATRKIATFTDVITELEYATESLSTSWISGGVISQNTTTTFDISAGTGRMFDGTPVSWDEMLNVAITNIATTISTRIAFDNTGSLIQLPVTLTEEVTRDYINAGVIVHPAGTITNILNTKLSTKELYSQYVDSLQTLGVTKKSGLGISPNADITFNKIAGELESVGAGINNGERGQNIVSINAESPAIFTRVLGISDTIVATGTTGIDPEFYDDGTATKASVPQANDATIIYIYQSIEPTGGLVVMYGQTVYTSLQDAVVNAPLDRVQIPEEITNDSNLIARIAVRRDATDISDISQAVVLAGVKFGTGIDGVGFGSISGGGDVFGPATASVDGVTTYADTSGKVIQSESDVTLLAGTARRITVNGDLKLKQNGTGAIKIEGDTGSSILDLDTTNATGDTFVRLSSEGTLSSSIMYQKNLGAIILQVGAGTALPTDQSTSYLAMLGNQRWEAGCSRYEQRVASGNIQYLMTSAGANTAGFSYIENVDSFNVRVGANPDPTGFDIFVPQTRFNHPVTPKTYTEAERDALVLTNVDDGAIINNSTSGKLQEKRGATWRDLSHVQEGGVFNVRGNGTSTTISALGSWVPCDFGSTSLMSSASNFIKATDTIVEYKGTSFVGSALINFDWEMEIGIPSETYEYEFAVFVGGAQVTTSGHTNTNADKDTNLMNASFSAPITLVNDSSINVRIRQNTGSVRNIKLTNASITFIRTA